MCIIHANGFVAPGNLVNFCHLRGVRRYAIKMHDARRKDGVACVLFLLIVEPFDYRVFSR